MSKERRENERVPVVLDAVVNYREHAIICTIKDLSTHGAFVEAQPEEMPFTNGSVEVGFSLTTSRGENKYYRLPANIRRVTGSGVGISFSGPDGGTVKLTDVAAAPGTPKAV
jgi:hypothetical protein